MNNLLKMNNYQLLRNRIYLGGCIGIFLLGFLTARTYETDVLGASGGIAASLSDIFIGMVYDSTFLHIIVSSLLALLLGQEFSHRTISQEVCSGHGRGTIFAGKVISYLLAFNFMIILYPFAGCIRQASRFGLGGAGSFLFLVIKAVLYSFLLNSAVFLPAFFCCFWLRNNGKAVAFYSRTDLSSQSVSGIWNEAGLSCFLLACLSDTKSGQHTGPVPSVLPAVGCCVGGRDALPVLAYVP